MQAFAQYDADRSGHIDINEFYRALSSLGLQISWVGVIYACDPTMPACLLMVPARARTFRLLIT